MEGHGEAERAGATGAAGADGEAESAEPAPLRLLLAPLLLGDAAAAAGPCEAPASAGAAAAPAASLAGPGPPAAARPAAVVAPPAPAADARTRQLLTCARLLAGLQAENASLGEALDHARRGKREAEAAAAEALTESVELRRRCAELARRPACGAAAGCARAAGLEAELRRAQVQGQRCSSVVGSRWFGCGTRSSPRRRGARRRWLRNWRPRARAAAAAASVPARETPPQEEELLGGSA
ncbi:unnamed protein product [Prorocentrum cordatum]|uniref:Uncharacterized protein n=1 Tax=Prorocentrum cordatum TaxID=2364126 RepID=A0ABN9TR55_9DINO|nr:unnamed protein product [Polarella glacialis]